LVEELINMNKINDVLILAGTHGNELSGVYIHKLIKEGIYNAERPSFSTSSIIANSKAVTHNTRYIDTDLNREFSSNNNDADSHEGLLSRQFVEKYAHKKKQLIIDLHNTTSNMGATLILLSNTLFYQKMGAYIKQQMPAANILFENEKSWSEQTYICTTGKYGVMIEIGAQAHGSLKYSTLELMKQMLSSLLDYVDKHNLNKMDTLNDYSAFYYTAEVKIPLDNDGMREAMVHPAICGKDFEVVKQGEPLFISLSGNDIDREGPLKVYPHFINESAYCKKNIGMALADKKWVSVR
jgi:succinylglutamate desuccinylase